MKVNSRQSQFSVFGWAQRLPAPDGSLPPRAPASRGVGGASRRAPDPEARGVELRASIDVAKRDTARPAGAFLPLILATYLGSVLGAAACATPRYVSDNHAALQSPVTLGEGHTGKPALDELPKEPASAPAVHSAPCASVVHPAPASPQPPAGEASGAASDPDASQPKAAAVATTAHSAAQPTAAGTTPAAASGPTAIASAPGATQTSAPGASQPTVATGPDAAETTPTPCVEPTSAPAGGAAADKPASGTSVAALLEGEPTETAPGSADAAASAAAPFDPRATPDPKDQATDAYYELTLRYCNAGVHLVKNRRVKLGKPSILPRKMGRFAAELWIGHELLERARFDFPMTAADTVAPAGTARPEPPPLQLAPGTDVVWKVKVADRVRATQAWVIDRATGERWLLDWPPAATKPKPTADAACPSFGGK